MEQLNNQDFAKYFKEGSITRRYLEREQEQAQENKKDTEAPKALRVELLNDLNYLVNERIYQ